MGYANPIEAYNLKHGADRFVADAAAAGVDGVLLIVDYPPRCEQFAATLKAHGLDLIFLAGPTSHPSAWTWWVARPAICVLRVAQGRDRRGHLDIAAVEAMLSPHPPACQRAGRCWFWHPRCRHRPRHQPGGRWVVIGTKLIQLIETQPRDWWPWWLPISGGVRQG